MFSARLFGAGRLVGFQFGRLERSILKTQKYVCKTYKNGIISVTVKAFSIWTFQVLETYSDRTGN